MEGTAVETQIEERRPECLEHPALVEHPAEFHTGEELHCITTWPLRVVTVYDNFPKLLQSFNSPPVSRQRNHPVETNGPMKRQRPNRLTPTKRDELNRQLKDAREAGLIRPSHSELDSPILFCEKILWLATIMQRLPWT
jgi:hypothetical protein